MAERRHAVHQDAAAHEEHGGRAGHRQALHEPRRRRQDAAAQGARRRAAALAQVQARVVQLHDAGHEAVDAHRHDQRDADQHAELRRERLALHGAQCDGDDFRREDEVGAHRALDLVLLDRDHVDRGVGHGLLVARGVGLVLLFVQELVDQLLGALEAQERAAHHEQWRHQPGQPGADGQRGRHQDRLVDEGALAHGPHHRQLALGAHAGDLLRVQREVVAEHPGGLLGSNFGEDGDVIEHGGDVVEQQEQAGGHGRKSGCGRSGELIRSRWPRR
ncbi:hypothetical protein D9M68_455540 [compost metagenome]